MDTWITGLIERMGYVGIALLMVLENVFPPIPSELVMPFAGFTAKRAELSLPLIILAGTAGSIIGALPWYAAGRLLGEERLKRFAREHGRWLTLSPEDVSRSQNWFHRHSTKAVLIGRVIPAVRTLISIPAGIARMSLPRFLVYSTIGSLVWTGALASLGYALGTQYDRVSAWLGPVSNVIVGGIVLWYLYRVVRWKQ